MVFYTVNDVMQILLKLELILYKIFFLFFHLQSSGANLSAVPRTFSKFGDHRFSACGPLA